MTLQKLSNLTDVSTPLLERRGLVSVHLRVGDKTLPPGGSEVVHVSPKLLADIQHYLQLEAVCLGDPPEKYLRVRAALEQEAVPPTQPTGAAPASPVLEEDLAVLVEDVGEPEEELEQEESAPAQSKKSSKKGRRRRRS